MAAKPKEKFDAAVKVIQNLPKNGSFQPSNELLLKFYAFYKQATLGPCNAPKPAFYDMVGKAKWDAWNKLGKMPSEEAMLNYVDELKKIVEAMPHTTMVAEFVEKLGNFYELVDEKDAAKAKQANAAEKKEDTPRPVLINGSTVHQNGDDNSTSSEPSPQHSASDESSESIDISPDGSPVHRSTPPVINPVSEANEVILAAIPTKPLGAARPMESDCGDTPSPSDQQPLQNGHLNGEHLDSDVVSDSDGEEFCDTSDLPDDQLRSVSRNSSPEVYTHSRIVTTATIHQTIDAENSNLPVEPDGPTHTVNQPVSDHVTCRGGGESGVDGQVSDIRRTSGVTSPSGSIRGGTGWRNSQPVQRTNFLASGGSGGGDRDPAYGMQRVEVNEQIAIALVRLQQDMNSVLARLNTLEALSVAQHQIHRSRTNSESDRPNRQMSAWWWPFPRLDVRSVFFIMAWPLIVHWVLTLLARRHQNRRR